MGPPVVDYAGRAPLSSRRSASPPALSTDPSADTRSVSAAASAPPSLARASHRRASSSSASDRSRCRVSPSIAALDLSTLSSRSLRTAGSVSSRSVRRRDVFRPPPATDAAGRALVLRAPSPPPVAPNFVFLADGAAAAPTAAPAPPAAAGPVYAHHQYLPPRRRGRDPEEVVRDRVRTRAPGDGTDPPGEAADARPFACRALVPHVPAPGAGEDAEGGGGGGGGGRFRRVTWVDPRSVAGEGRIDRAVLRDYDRLAGAAQAADEVVDRPRLPGNITSVDPPSSTELALALPALPPPSPTALLLRNPRTRIATVSSGYKKAKYFVREDLDTRIYFHQVEDAVGYMAKRGYVQMEKEEEDEWKELLERAHKVVKVNKNQGKQRYRKGKLVLVLKKTITNDDHRNTSRALTTKKQRRGHGSGGRRRSSRKKKQLLLEDGSSTLPSGRTTTDQTSVTESFSGTSRTSRTSIGRSVRQGYGSYSEKFLAEQEEHQRKFLQAVAEGRPLLDAYPQDAGAGEGKLLLTDGSRGSVDPSGDRCTLSRMSRANEASTYVSSQGESTMGEEITKMEEDFQKSTVTAESNRKGVYGGGVRYFTPHNEGEYEEEEEEETSEDDESYEEEAGHTSPTDQEEEETYQKHEEMDTVEVDGSDMASLFSPTEDERPRYNTSGGVESVTSTMSTGWSQYPLPVTERDADVP